MDLNKILTILTVAGVTTFAAPDFSMIGFATEDGGTTGGAGGKVVTVTNLEDLKKYAEDLTTPYIILVKGEINTNIPVKVDDMGKVGGSISSTYGDVVKVGSNKSIIGLGNSAFFNRVGILVVKKSNIIIRNIKFTMINAPIGKTDENKILAWDKANNTTVILSDIDCLGFQADSAASSLEDKKKQFCKNIWVDHCEFYNEHAATDRYDGLLDAKNNFYNVTLSWNYFHDHDKGLLIGNDDKDALRHEVTIHHNYFKNITSRQPLMRHSKAHLFNNFIVGTGKENSTDVRINSDLYIESNHYAYLSKAIFAQKADGKATIINNKFEGCEEGNTDCNKNKMRVPDVPTLGNDTVYCQLFDAIPKGSFIPSYNYKSVLDPVSNVKSIVTTYAGVGKISTEEYERQSTGVLVHQSIKKNFTTLVNNHSITVNALPGTVINLYNALGTKLFSGNVSKIGELSIPVKNGVYIMSVDLGSEKIIVH